MTDAKQVRVQWKFRDIEAAYDSGLIGLPTMIERMEDCVRREFPNEPDPIRFTQRLCKIFEEKPNA